MLGVRPFPWFGVFEKTGSILARPKSGFGVAESLFLQEGLWEPTLQSPTRSSTRFECRVRALGFSATCRMWGLGFGDQSPTPQKSKPGMNLDTLPCGKKANDSKSVIDHHRSKGTICRGGLDPTT